MVTPTSDPFFRVKGQQKGQIFIFVRFQRLRCQIVGLGQAIKSSHSDPDIRPLLWGQRSIERSNFQLCPISTIEVSNCSSRPHDRKLSWWPRRPTLSLGSKVTRKVKFSTLSDFNDWGIKLFVPATRSKVVMVTPTSDPFFGVKGQQKDPNYNFVRFQRLTCQIVVSFFPFNCNETLSVISISASWNICKTSFCVIFGLRDPCCIPRNLPRALAKGTRF